MTAPPPRRSLAGALLVLSIAALALNLRAATGGWTVPVAALLLICGVELAVGLFAGRPKVLPADWCGTRVAAGEAHPKLLKCVRAGRRVTLISGAMSGGE